MKPEILVNFETFSYSETLYDPGMVPPGTAYLYSNSGTVPGVLGHVITHLENEGQDHGEFH